MEQVHQVVLTERNLLTVTRLNEVISFDDTTVNLDVGGSTLTISGSSLTVQKLSLNEEEGREIIIAGSIDAVVYTDGGRRRRRLFGL